MKPLTFILFVLSSLVLSSCSKKGGRCEHVPSINQSEVILHIIDKNSGKFVYTQIQPQYDKDSFRVIDPQGHSLKILYLMQGIPNSLDNYYVLSFGPLFNPDVDQASFEQELCKRYVLYYRPGETDTLDACFTAKKTKCGTAFSTLKVYHRQQLITSVKDSVAAHITLLK